MNDARKEEPRWRGGETREIGVVVLRLSSSLRNSRLERMCGPRARPFFPDRPRRIIARRFLVDDVRDANAAAGHSARATTATASRTRHAEHATMSDPWADPVGPSGGWGTRGAAPVRARDARSRDAPSSPRRGFVARFPPARRDVFAAPRPLSASTPRGGPRARSLLTFAHPPLDPLRPPLPGVRASRRLCRPSRWTARTSPSPRSGGGRDAPRTNA